MAIDKVSKPTKGGGIDVPPGTHVALFAGLVHLGTQKGEYQGKVSYNDQVLAYFELPDITLEDGRPITLTARMNHKLGSGKGKKSTMLVLGEALNGGKECKEGIDWEDNIGKPLMVVLETNSKGTGVNIKNYMPIMESLKKGLKGLVGEPKLYYDVEKISDKELEGLSEWVRKVINERVRAQDATNEATNY